jgi:hypothetical protein
VTDFLTDCPVSSVEHISSLDKRNALLCRAPVRPNSSGVISRGAERPLMPGELRNAPHFSSEGNAMPDKKPFTHWIEKCYTCDSVMSQCNCPGENKRIRYGRCEECRDKAIAAIPRWCTETDNPKKISEENALMENTVNDMIIESRKR